MSDEQQSVQILPDTKLAELFDAYPHLETAAEKLLPSYAKLTTPILRKTVARTLTIEQAAAASGLSVPEIVRSLRQAAGLSERTLNDVPDSAPDWLKKAAPSKTIDARPMLAQGQHPKEMVAQELKVMQTGEILLLIAPFVPGPLIEMGRSTGCEVWTRQKHTGYVETYFRKF